MSRTCAFGRVVTWLVVGGLVAWGCTFGVDPDRARFRCSDNEDCGQSYVCRVQSQQDAGVCFPEAQCLAESCNATDDDCDGVADNGFDLETNAEHCGVCGQACTAGQVCTAGVCG